MWDTASWRIQGRVHKLDATAAITKARPQAKWSFLCPGNCWAEWHLYSSVPCNTTGELDSKLNHKRKNISGHCILGIASTIHLNFEQSKKSNLIIYKPKSRILDWEGKWSIVVTTTSNVRLSAQNTNYKCNFTTYQDINKSNSKRRPFGINLTEVMN